MRRVHMFVFVHAYVLLMLMVTHKGVNWHSKYITQVQQQRPKSPTVTLTWHACKHKVRKLHLRSGMHVNTRYINSTRGTPSLEDVPLVEFT